MIINFEPIVGLIYIEKGTQKNLGPCYPFSSKSKMIYNNKSEAYDLYQSQRMKGFKLN